MTIIQAIKTVLIKENKGLDVDRIYELIIKNNLYTFNAKNPKGVVNGEIRRHCLDLDFPTASPVKHFYIVEIKGKKPIYDILNDANKAIRKKEKKEEGLEYFLPEEKVEKTINDYNEQIKKQLIQRILNQEPSFFEQLVVDLLLKMGYGHDRSAGTVVGRSHDGGIDGIISEDKLGLDIIYIQAKRYDKSNSVGRKEVQAFVGAMEGVSKGVFLTTSSFTRESISYAEKVQHKHIRLIDGNQLCDFMLKYEVGVQAIKTYKLFKINEDFFTD